MQVNPNGLIVQSPQRTTVSQKALLNTPEHLPQNRSMDPNERFNTQANLKGPYREFPEFNPNQGALLYELHQQLGRTSPFQGQLDLWV